MGFPHSSVGKESTCNAGDPGLIPGSGRSAGEVIGYLPQNFTLLTQFLFHNSFYGSFPDNSVGKESTCNAGDPGSIPGSGSSPG